MMIEPLWDDEVASGLDELGQLVYASNLLGRDPRVTNFGGGNTSSKFVQTDPLSGEEVTVLWVKGSGGDLGSATKSSFASLYQDKVLQIERVLTSRGAHEDEAVQMYPHAVFGSNPTACSIDTPLHSLVPAKAVSHMHADAVIAIAAAADSTRLCQEVWGGQLGYLPWKRPGLALGVMLRELVEANPHVCGALMASHGFICWADDWKSCYELTIRLINQAQEFIDNHGRSSPFGGSIREPKGPSGQAVLLDLLPKLRGATAYQGKRLVASVDTSDEVCGFLASESCEKLVDLGTSCPDHFLRTKIRPMVWNLGSDLGEVLDAYRQRYAAYYARCKKGDSPDMRNPNPSVVLIPGIGMVSLGKDPKEARVTGEFYRNAIRVMAGAEAVSTYTALPEQEAFDIEYWTLEEAKLRRMPKEQELSRMVAVVTGGGQGIGRASAERMLKDGACVVLLDIAEDILIQTVDELAMEAPERVKGFVADVTDSEQLLAAFNRAILAFGGIDIVVVNAGNARRGTVAETPPEDFRLLSDLLVKAYFDSIAIAVRTMSDQGLGGSIVVVASKNGTAAGSGAALYSAAKAFELHLARCVALDHAKQGIRCNSVNPDAVVMGSGIWNDEWRKQTATSLGIDPSELESHYRERTLLKVDVTPADVAEAVFWLASPTRSSRTTGCIITVDGGNREGFTR